MKWHDLCTVDWRHSASKRFVYGASIKKAAARAEQQKRVAEGQSRDAESRFGWLEG